MQSMTRGPGLHLANSAFKTSKLTKSRSQPTTSLGARSDTAVTTSQILSTKEATSVTKDTQELSSGAQVPVVTPEMRKVALQMLGKGCPPSSLGTILPSLHPGFLRALFLGPMSNVDQCFKTAKVVTKTHSKATSKTVDDSFDDNDYIIYLDEWTIKETIDQAIAKAQTTSSQNLTVPTADSREIASYVKTVTRIQNRVCRALSHLQVKVQNWKTYDTMREQAEKEALEAKVTDPLTERPGALEGLVDYWRGRLGWIEPAVGYWYDSAATAISGARFRFVAYGPAEMSDPASDAKKSSGPLNDKKVSSVDESAKVKHIWSNISGAWKTEKGLAQEFEKIRQDRNAWLVSEIGRIERERDEDFVREGVGFVLQYLGGVHEAILGEWSGGTGPAGQKATKRRRIKKQVPERRYGSIEFVPEDGGPTALKRLSDAVLAEGDKRPGLYGGPEAEQDQGAHKKIGSSAAERDVNTEQNIKKTTNPRKRKADQDDTTKEGERVLDTEAVEDDNKQRNKRKRTVEPKPKPKPKQNSRSPRAATAPPPVPRSPKLIPVSEHSRPASPSKKKRKVEPSIKVELPPPLAATRKSSRIAKRKAEGSDLEDNEAVTARGNNPKRARSGNAAPAKKRRIAKDTRDATLSVEPVRAVDPTHMSPTNANPSEIPDSDGPAPLSGPSHSQHNSNSNDATDDPVRQKSGIQPSHPTTAVDISGSPLPAVTSTLASTSKPTSTSPQVTPHKPTSTTFITTDTSITTSPLKPLTPTTRTKLMDSYPFLLRIPDSDPDSDQATTGPVSSAGPSQSAHNSSSTADNNNNTTTTTTSASSSSSAAAAGPATQTQAQTQTQTTTTTAPTRRAAWLAFLHFFGRETGVISRLNAFFDQDGAVSREAEFLECLKAAVGRIRRVDDAPDSGEKRFVWVD